MSMFSALEISGSAMGAERQRAEVVATNMANAETTRTPSGGPFRRKQVVFSGGNNSPFQLALAGFRRLTGQVVGGAYFEGGERSCASGHALRAGTS